MRLFLAFSVLLATPVLGATAYRSADGNLYLIKDSATSGPSFEKLNIVDLDDPVDPKPPKQDQFGLIKASADALKTVPSYSGREDDASKLAAYYTAMSGSVESGVITQAQLGVAVDAVFKSAVGNNASKWQDWKDETTNAFNAAPINSSKDAAQGLRDIAQGIIRDEGQAANWEQLIRFFIETILPLILTLLNNGS